MIDLSKYEDVDAQDLAYQYKREAQGHRRARRERRELKEARREGQK
jgi:hypothetical protein